MTRHRYVANDGPSPMSKAMDILLFIGRLDHAPVHVHIKGLSSLPCLSPIDHSFYFTLSHTPSFINT